MPQESACGLCSKEQYLHSIKTRIAEGLLSPEEIIRILAVDLATAKNEHALRMALSEFAYEIRDGKLYSPDFKIYFDDLINPPEHLRTKDYIPLAPHILDNLKKSQELLISGKVQSLVILSPSVDFEKERIGNAEPKGQAYRMRRVGDQILVTCTDHSSSEKNECQDRSAEQASSNKLREEVKAFYTGIDYSKSLGVNEINGGGVFEDTSQRILTRQDAAEIMLKLERKELYQQYQAAIYIGEGIDPKDYLETLIRREEQNIYKMLEAKGLSLTDNPQSAMRTAVEAIGFEIQSIRAELTRTYPLQDSAHKQYPTTNDSFSDLPYQGTLVNPDRTNHSWPDNHDKLTQTYSSCQAERLLPIINSNNTTQTLNLAFSNILFNHHYRDAALSESSKPDKNIQTEIILAQSIDLVRFKNDVLYRFLKLAESGASLETAGMSIPGIIRTREHQNNKNSHLSNRTIELTNKIARSNDHKNTAIFFPLQNHNKPVRTNGKMLLSAKNVKILERQLSADNKSSKLSYIVPAKSQRSKSFLQDRKNSVVAGNRAKDSGKISIQVRLLKQLILANIKLNHSKTAGKSFKNPKVELLKLILERQQKNASDLNKLKRLLFTCKKQIAKNKNMAAKKLLPDKIRLLNEKTLLLKQRIRILATVKKNIDNPTSSRQLRYCLKLSFLIDRIKRLITANLNRKDSVNRKQNSKLILQNLSSALKIMIKLSSRISSKGTDSRVRRILEIHKLLQEEEISASMLSELLELISAEEEELFLANKGKRKKTPKKSSLYRRQYMLKTERHSLGLKLNTDLSRKESNKDAWKRTITNQTNGNIILSTATASYSLDISTMRESDEQDC